MSESDSYSVSIVSHNMHPAHTIPLHLLPLKQWARVVGLTHFAPDHPPSKKDSPGASQDLLEQLLSIGFAPDEQVCVLTAGKPGNDPLVVRIGTSTFALRRSEASHVLVAPLDPAAQQEAPDA
jgi:ferrous iron transport protein A